MTDLTYAKLIADSIGQSAPRLVTMELQYPRMIHAEFMTHRVFSRNASSSRAIPVARMLQTVQEHCAMPASWRLEQAGMQGFEEASDALRHAGEQITLEAMRNAVRSARKLADHGFHKQHVNRLTEPFQYIKVVVTSSQWDNFFGLRDHEAADPTIQHLAGLMREAFYPDTPPTVLQDGQWHLPYITDEDWLRVTAYQEETGNDLDPLEVLRRMSAARCARVSYNNFKGDVPKVSSDLALYAKLVVSQPVHASPTEHQASPDLFIGKNFGWRSPEKHGNLNGWLQFRKFIENENLDQPIY